MSTMEDGEVNILIVYILLKIGLYLNQVLLLVYHLLHGCIKH